MQGAGIKINYYGPKELEELKIHNEEVTIVFRKKNMEREKAFKILQVPDGS